MVGPVTQVRRVWGRGGGSWQRWLSGRPRDSSTEGLGSRGSALTHLLFSFYSTFFLSKFFFFSSPVAIATATGGNSLSWL